MKDANDSKQMEMTQTNDDGDELFLPKGVSWGVWCEGDSSLQQVIAGKQSLKDASFLPQICSLFEDIRVRVATSRSVWSPLQQRLMTSLDFTRSISEL